MRRFRSREEVFIWPEFSTVFHNVIFRDSCITTCTVGSWRRWSRWIYFKRGCLLKLSLVYQFIFFVNFFIIINISFYMDQNRLYGITCFIIALCVCVFLCGCVWVGGWDNLSWLMSLMYLHTNMYTTVCTCVHVCVCVCVCVCVGGWDNLSWLMSLMYVHTNMYATVCTCVHVCVCVCGWVG